MESVKNKDVSGCKKIHITLRISEGCNRKCSYCHWHYGKNYELKDILNIIEIIKNKFKKNQLLFYIHGGEPCIHPDLTEILKKIKEVNGVTELQTNFDHIDVINKNKHLIDRLDISYHYPNNMKQFKAKILAFKNKLNCVDLVYHKKNKNEILNLKKFLNKRKIHNEVTYNFFESINNENTLDKELRELLTDQEIIKNRYFNNEIKITAKCDTTNYAIINGNGDIFRCSHQLTNYPSTCNILKDKNCLEKVMINDFCPYEYCGYEYEYLKGI